MEHIPATTSPSIDNSARAISSPAYKSVASLVACTKAGRWSRNSRSPGAPLYLFSFFLLRSSLYLPSHARARNAVTLTDAATAMPRCLMAKKWKSAAGEVGEESDEEIDVVGEGRGRSPAPAATAPGPAPRDPEPTLLYNGRYKLRTPPLSLSQLSSFPSVPHEYSHKQENMCEVNNLIN